MVAIPFLNSIKSQKSEAGKMAQKIRGLAAKPEDLSLIPRLTWQEGATLLKLFSDIYIDVPRQEINKCNKNKKPDKSVTTINLSKENAFYK